MARLKRISSKKEYMVQFTGANGQVAEITVKGASSMLECASKAKEVCNFVPSRLRITDIQNGETVSYYTHLELRFPED